MKIACEKCGVERPLVEFRRFVPTRGRAGEGRKVVRALHKVCNVCAPPEIKRHPDAVPDLIKKMLEARRSARVSELRREGAERRHSRERRKAWSDALLKPLQDEREWALRNAASAARLKDKESRAAQLERDPHANPDDEEASAKYACWEEFFNVYAQVLFEMRRDIQKALERQDRPGNPIKPGETQNQLHHYVDPSTLASLARIYSDCVPVRGRRLYRDPLFLIWRDVT